MAAVFVHLSDIHFGQERQPGDLVVNTDARERLIDDAASFVRESLQGRASGIIVTGDIAYAGQKHEYHTAGLWLDRLAHRVGCEPSDIQMVPGNHDVDRKKFQGAAELMLNAIRDDGEEKLNGFLKTEVDREVLYYRFEAYREFADAYHCPLNCEGMSTAERSVALADGRSIRFVRINSALTCSKTSQDDYGKLVLGAGQRVMYAAPGEELVVLTHHPLNWIADSADMSRYLKGRARVLISGHEHLAAVAIEKIEDGSDLISLAAGATTPEKIDGPYTYAYNIIEFDWDELQDALIVKVRTRSWNDEYKRFDSSQYGLQEFTLGSPNFRKAKKPEKAKANVLSGNTEVAKVEIHLPADEAPSSQQGNSSEYHNLHLNFFRDLNSSSRMDVFHQLGALPVGFQGALSHGVASKLFYSLISDDRFEEVRTVIEAELSKQKNQGMK